MKVLDMDVKVFKLLVADFACFSILFEPSFNLIALVGEVGRNVNKIQLSFHCSGKVNSLKKKNKICLNAKCHEHRNEK